MADLRPATGRFYPWLILVFFWLIYFLSHADRQVIFSVLPLIKQEMHVTDTQLGLMSSLFFWVFAILVPIGGNLGDVVNRKWLIVGALLAWSTATGASAAVGGFFWLVLLRAGTATGEAFYYPAANSILSDYHGEKTRATAMAIHQTSVYTGIIVSGTLAGYIGEHYGWRTAFFWFGAVGFVVALLAARFIREPRRGQAEDTAFVVTRAPLGERVRETFQSPTAVMLTLAFLGMILVNTAYLTWTPTLLNRKFHLSLAAAGFHATFWHHAGAALGVLVGGKASDFWASHSTLARPLIQMAGLFLGAPFIFLLGWSDSQPAVFAALALFGFFRGLYDSNLLASLFEVVRPQARATATGIMLATAFLGGGFAPVVTGWLGEQMSLGWALSATSLCYLVSGAFILLDCVFFFRRDAARMRALLGGTLPRVTQA